MLSTQEKISKLDEKIDILKRQQSTLHRRLEAQIIDMMKSHKAFHVEFSILYGALDELMQKLQNSDTTTLEIWQRKGLERLTKKAKKAETHTDRHA